MPARGAKLDLCFIALRQINFTVGRLFFLSVIIYCLFLSEYDCKKNKNTAGGNSRSFLWKCTSETWQHFCSHHLGSPAANQRSCRSHCCTAFVRIMLFLYVISLRSVQLRPVCGRNAFCDSGVARAARYILQTQVLLCLTYTPIDFPDAALKSTRLFPEMLNCITLSLRSRALIIFKAVA